MNKWVWGIFLTAIVASGVAHAEGKKSDSINAKFNQLFKNVDADGNGRISMSEAESRAPAMAENFGLIDTNQDGGLSKVEIKTFTAMLIKRRQEFSQHLRNADKDSNGTLSRDEAMSLPKLGNNFDAIDENHDEQLSLKEISDYLRALTTTARAEASTTAVSIDQ